MFSGRNKQNNIWYILIPGVKSGAHWLPNASVLCFWRVKGTTRLPECWTLKNIIENSQKKKLEELCKEVFCLGFYFKWKYFVLIDRILSEIICLLWFSVLFSNVYSKIKFTAKNWSDLCNFYSKVIFWIFWLRKYFLFSLLNLNY